MKIPISRIRLLPGQPREEFDENELDGLALSIATIEQMAQISVCLLSGYEQYDYQLIDGERRIRAHQKLGLEMIEAEIKPSVSEDDLFIYAVASNLGRVGHKPLEIAHALRKMIDTFIAKGCTEGQAVKKASEVCARTNDTWVYQHLSLLKLVPEVQTLLKEKKLNFQVCRTLTSLRPESQTLFANHIVEKDLNFTQALHYVQTNKNGHVSEGGRGRRPSDDYDHLVRFLKGLGDKSELILDIKQDRFVAMFEKREPEDLSKIIDMISDQIGSLELLKMGFQEILEKKNPPSVEVEQEANVA